MRCDDCCQDPCTCQRALAATSSRPRVPQKYEFHECTTPGCHVMIGFQAGAVNGLTTCRWCQGGVAYYAR